MSEVQRLRAENEYLKNLQALFLEDERHQHRNIGSSKAEAKAFLEDSSLNRSTATYNLLLSPEADAEDRQTRICQGKNYGNLPQNKVS